ncbi:hypothetical protein FDK12_04815 [Arthrobacter sp. NamB2]|uniref:hypothetical protein n=1 Tax=Arthrobacter sp. NamB2 TaxID=2576035 RepID=UPI0010C9C20C|nr:hypothetical protein [Arthrobacter sp. NamB2]TKV28987.1 hypothetical protein FDK12_04815 [Arthrobacter sp. NamB2]
MKKNVRVTHELEESAALAAAFAAGVVAAREWASPHVDAAYGWAKPRWEKGIETAGPALQETVRKAAEGISSGIAVVTPKIQDGIDSVGPRITQVIDETTPRIQETLDKATPVLNSAKGKVVDDYLPALSSKLGEAADTASRSLAAATVPPVVEKAVTKVTGDKNTVKNAQKRLVAATLQASKELNRSQAKKSGKGWLIFGIISAAIVAGVAAWRASKPVEDPWKTPAPIRTTPAGSGKNSQDAKDVVSSIKEAAERAATSDNETGESKDKPAHAAEAVADRAKDVTETAKHAAKPSDGTQA